MMRPVPQRVALILVVVLFAACSDDAAEPAPAASGPSGSLGVMAAGAAAETIDAMCRLRTTTDRDEANTLFFDRAHQSLHVLAAATEVVDRVPAAGLLEAKQAVEADLQADTLPAGFAEDVGALLDASQRALATIDLPAPHC